MKLSIIGDSFSSDENDDSWIALLKKQHRVLNYSSRGISQYRIFDIVQQNITDILSSDCVIFWHTNPDRIFVNDDVIFPTRTIASHPHADLVANDSLSCRDNEWKKIAQMYYKIFFNTKQQNLYYQLLLKELMLLVEPVKIKIHCSGFNIDNVKTHSYIKSFYDTKNQFPGNSNHMNANGNLLVFNYLNNFLL